MDLRIKRQIRVDLYAERTDVYVCVCVCVYAAFVDARKTVEIDTSFFLIARNNTGHNLQEFDTNA